MLQKKIAGWLAVKTLATLPMVLLCLSAEVVGAPRELPPPSIKRFNPVDSFTLDDGRRVQTVELPNCRCFQPNAQFGQIDDHDRKFVNGDWGNHEFVLVLPANYSTGSFPVFLNLRGGGFAWVDVSIPTEQIPPNARGVLSDETRTEGMHFGFPLLSTQWWNRKHAYSALTFQPLEEVPSQRGNPTTFVNQLRKRFPGWGILYPSYCSRDAYIGRGEMGRDGRRFGYLALLEALDYVDTNHGIDRMFVGGTSAGGLGSAVVARDLPKDRPDLELLGAIIDSGPAEGEGYAALKDDGVVAGLRRIALDDGTKAWIPCDHPLQNMARGLAAIRFLDFSLTRAIEEGQITVPLFHAWQSRDNITLCGDLEFSKQFMDGAIARAIAKHNPAGASVSYQQCEGITPACTQDAATTVERCAPEKIVQVPCSKHGVLARGPRVADALAWMERVMKK